MADGFDLISRSQRATSEVFGSLARNITAANEAQNQAYRNTFNLTNLGVNYANERLRLNESIRVNNQNIRSSVLRDKLSVNRASLDNARFQADQARAAERMAMDRANFLMEADRELYRLEDEEILRDAIQTGDVDFGSDRIKKRKERINGYMRSAVDSVRPETDDYGNRVLDNLLKSPAKDFYDGSIPDDTLLGDDTSFETVESQDARRGIRGDESRDFDSDFLDGPLTPDEKRAIIQSEQEDGLIPTREDEIELPPPPFEEEQGETEARAPRKDTIETAKMKAAYIASLNGNPILKEQALLKIGNLEPFKERRYMALSSIVADEGEVSGRGAAEVLEANFGTPEDAYMLAGATNSRNSVGRKLFAVDKELADTAKSIAQTEPLTTVDSDGSGIIASNVEAKKKELAKYKIIEDRLEKERKRLEKIYNEQQTIIDSVLDRNRPQSLIQPVEPVEPDDDATTDEDEPKIDPKDLAIFGSAINTGLRGGENRFISNVEGARTPVSNADIADNINRRVFNDNIGVPINLDIKPNDYKDITETNGDIELTEEAKGRVFSAIKNKVNTLYGSNDPDSQLERGKITQAIASKDNLRALAETRLTAMRLGSSGLRFFESQEAKRMNAIIRALSNKPLSESLKNLGRVSKATQDDFIRAKYKPDSSIGRLRLYSQIEATYRIAEMQGNRFYEKSAELDAKRQEIAQ